MVEMSGEGPVMLSFFKLLKLIKDEEQHRTLTPYSAYEVQKKWMTQAMLFFLIVIIGVLIWSWIR